MDQSTAKFPRLFFALILALGIGLVGCTRCVECSDCPAGVVLESEVICEDDYNSQAAFQQDIDIAEGFGCTCTDI